MELKPDINIYKISIVLLQFLGENLNHTFYTTKKLIAYRLFNCIVFLFLLIFTLANLLRINSGLYVKTLQSVFIIVHVLLKYNLFIYYQSDIKFLLNTRLRFWNYGSCKNRKLWLEFYRRVRIVQIIIVAASFMVVMLYCIRPVISSNTNFILETWVFNNCLFLEAFVLLCQYYYFCIAVSITIGYDLIYLSLCTDTVIQVRLLKCKIECSLSDAEGNKWEDINDIVVHHQILLSTFRRMKTIYSIMLLFHYFVTLIGACTHLYELLGQSDTAHIIINFVSIYIFFAEFACYTFPAEQVAVEFADISNAIYASKWYQNDINVQKCLLFMMLESYREEYFTGGGIISMNAETFGSVVRKTFSFYAILRNILSK